MALDGRETARNAYWTSARHSVAGRSDEVVVYIAGSHG
jgi:hypothetical protein